MRNQKWIKCAMTGLSGSEPRPSPNASRIGPVDDAEVAQITVRIRSRLSLAERERQVAALYSKDYSKRAYFSRQQLAAQFGATTGDLEEVVSYAQEHGLTVVRKNRSERCIVLTGSLQELLAAFPTDLHLERQKAGIFRKRDAPINVPVHLTQIITGIFGYETTPRHKRSYHSKALAAEAPGQPRGKFATTFAARYRFPARRGAVKLDGCGQCIGFIELAGGFSDDDLESYFRKLKIAKPLIRSVFVDRASKNVVRADLNNGEVTLDLEVAGTIVPGALLAVYHSPNTNRGFMDALSFAVHDRERKPDIISISWGFPEIATEEQSLKAFHELFLDAAALGVTVCTTTGDHGTAYLEASDWDGKIHVDHPSADPLVLACGGTQIDSTGNDVVWNDGTAFDGKVAGGGGWATGGGISQAFPVPAYQSDVRPPRSLVSGERGRGVPDISMCAVPYYSFIGGKGVANGGTSAVAPLMAGLVARLNQAGKKNVGFLNPFLYSHASLGVARPVCSGHNGIKSTVKGYRARAGWSACSGLGTPDGKHLMRALLHNPQAII